jgi:hypothetical protein
VGETIASRGLWEGSAGNRTPSHGIRIVPLSLQVAERPKLIVHCITAFTVASVAVMCSMWVLHRPPVTPAADPDAAHDAVR